MPNDDRPGPEEAAAEDRASDELEGLDPTDPDVQALAAHLQRMRTATPAFTVEGTIERVGDYAESTRRTRGPVKVLALVLAVALVVWLLVAGVAWLL